MSPGLNIAALSRRTGVAPDTLRKWEQRYRILRPSRTEGGQRRYSEHDVDRVLWLKARLEEGYRIGEAATLLGLDSDETATDPADHVTLIFAAAARSDVAAVNRLLDHAFAHDLLTTCNQIVQPLLVQIGEAWHAGSFSMSQEHLVTGAVRARLERKLAETRAAIHGRAVLACGPGERHELGLLMLAVLLRADGWDVAYLGPDLPVEETMRLVCESNAQLVAFSVGTRETANALEAGLRELEWPAQLSVLVGGLAANPLLAGRIGGIYLGSDLATTIARLRAPTATVA